MQKEIAGLKTRINSSEDSTENSIQNRSDQIRKADQFPIRPEPRHDVATDQTERPFGKTSGAVEKAIFDFEREYVPQSGTPSLALDEKSPAPTADKILQADGITILLANAELLIRHGDKNLAKALVFKALAIDSHHPAAVQMSLQFLNPIKDLDKIAKIYEVLCAVKYDFSSVYGLAQSYYKMGNDEKALERYNEALTLVISEDSRVFEICKNIGNILTRNGDFDGAEESYYRAFALQPDSDVLLVNMGTLELQQNDFPKAIERFRRAIEMNPKNDKAWVGLALVHEKMGDFALALANIEKAMDLNKENRTALHIFANWQTKEKNYKAVVDRLQSYLATVEYDEEMSILLIHVCCLYKRFDIAKFEITRAIEWNPESHELKLIYDELFKNPGEFQ